MQVCLTTKTITRKKKSGVLKGELLNSLRGSDTAKEQELNIQNIIDQIEAVDIIKRHEDIIKAIRYEAIQEHMSI